MEIPPESRAEARAFLEHAGRMEQIERRQIRWDGFSLVAIGFAMAMNIVAAVLNDSTALSALYPAANAALGLAFGMTLVRVQRRRAEYRQLVAFAAETETALAFHELDEA